MFCSGPRNWTSSSWRPSTPSNPDWPSGIISHVAGFTSDGMYVVDVWESQQDFDAFADTRLMPAFEAVGGLPSLMSPRLKFTTATLLKIVQRTATSNLDLAGLRDSRIPH
jgi:hypothetical protein